MRDQFLDWVLNIIAGAAGEACGERPRL